MNKKSNHLMPVIFFIVSGCSISLLSCQNGSQDEPDTDKISSFEQLKAEFIDPSAKYRTVPFAVWNGEVTHEKIDRQITELKQSGVGGIFIHPRWGMITEYLDSAWYELVEYTVKSGEEMGLNVWLYDENTFPSGFAGGHVAEQMTDAYQHGQALVEVKQNILTPGINTTYTRVLMKNRTDDSFVDITEQVSDFEGKPGEYYLYENKAYFPSARYGGYSYVDLIYPGVTEKFIEVTMPGYEQTVGEYFGNSVPGIFTDEPNIKPPSGDGIRYTPDLFEQFERRWGYKLDENLPSLFNEIGNWRRVRHNYYQILLQLFIDRWAKPWYNYTEEQNLKWTGHYWEHGWPNPQHGGDNMAMYAWHQVPGIDMLFNTQEERPDQFGNVRAVKELISVANQMGYQRTLSETYGAAGWEIRFEDLKRLGDWQHTLGVNLMNQHLAYMDIIGDRKHDFPQSFSSHNAWWKHYKVLNDYFGRLCAALASGDQINKVLVIEPTTSAWMYYVPGEENVVMNNIGDRFDSWIRYIEKNQVEYDLGCENIIKDHGSVEDDLFVINQRKYNVVILPPGTESLDLATWELLKKYIDNGGIVYSVVNFPKFIDGAESADYKTYAEIYKINWRHLKNAEEIPANWYLSEEFVMVDPASIKGLLYHQHRILDDGEVLFLSNFDENENAAGTFRAKGKDVLYMDLFDGSIYKYPHQKQGQLLEVTFDITPHGSMLFFIPDKEMDFDTYQQPAVIKEQIAGTGEIKVNREQKNTLVLDYPDIYLNKWENNMLFYNAAAKVFRAHGFDANPWSVTAQFKSNIVDRDTFPEGTGYKARFHFTVDKEFDVQTPLQLSVERPDVFKVFVNDHEVNALDGEWWLDPEFGLYDISELYKTGKNTIRLEVSPMSVFAELEPVYIIGDFSLESQDKGWKITSTDKQLSTGSWAQQGLPMYSGAVSYTSTFSLDETACIVKLSDWFGTVASVLVNGEEAGIIGWKPYQLDISDYVNPGINEITVNIYGSLKNLLGPHHNVTRSGIVTPWSWRFGPENQPAGVAYDVLDYGLFEPFSVYTIDEYN